MDYFSIRNLIFYVNPIFFYFKILFSMFRKQFSLSRKVGCDPEILLSAENKWLKELSKSFPDFRFLGLSFKIISLNKNSILSKIKISFYLLYFNPIT